MKIEIGESLILSWLKHIKECQLVQTNWKPSNKWELKHGDVLEKLMEKSAQVFKSKHGYDLYKGNSGIKQVLTQAEIDVIGMKFGERGKHIYAIDVAFHELGLNYGAKDETVTRVVKKCIRTAMCVYGYFDIDYGTIIFTSPKINLAAMSGISNCIEDIENVLHSLGLNYKIEIIANEEFSSRILEPVLNVTEEVADTSELFMRSVQMYNIFSDKKPKSITVNNRKPIERQRPYNYKSVESNDFDTMKEMKIGMIVRTVLREMLENGEVSKEEVEKMQTKQYSKETFDIQYPLLQKVKSTDVESPRRYYAKPLRIYGDKYYMCSEWYEVPANNDRPFLMKWLALHK